LITSVSARQSQLVKKNARRFDSLIPDITSRADFETPLHVSSVFVNGKPHNMGLKFNVLSNILCTIAILLGERSDGDMRV